ncbi:response regulator transcription factor [Acetivibrio cellulolyticus]|uniref:response regulator transcription factor n=1 Tax=Acetivibrio cellulolyticus TaxID=35830 RepID=UPI0001E2C7B2|nr:response regulator transcription factor [Acetivibrio cellulolyticus]
MIKVMIVDDLVIFRDTLKYMLDHDPGIEVVGGASNGFEAFELCKRMQVDLVLMDILMPDCDGVEGTRLIKQHFPNIKIIILTTFQDDENVSNSLKNGADSYVLKDISAVELIHAIKSVYQGYNIIQKNIFEKVVQKLDGNEPHNLEESTALAKLNEREIKVIQLVVDGKSNNQIAEELFLTEGSVRNIVSSLLRKLDLKDRVQLAVFAVRNKLV